METEIKKKPRDFATRISAEDKARWNEVKEDFPRSTRNIHIMAYTKLSKPIVTRAMTDNMATIRTFKRIDKFFNRFLK